MYMKQRFSLLTAFLMLLAWTFLPVAAEEADKGTTVYAEEPSVQETVPSTDIPEAPSALTAEPVITEAPKPVPAETAADTPAATAEPVITDAPKPALTAEPVLTETPSATQHPTETQTAPTEKPDMLPTDEPDSGTMDEEEPSVELTPEPETTPEAEPVANGPESEMGGESPAAKEPETESSEDTETPDTSGKKKTTDVTEDEAEVFVPGYVHIPSSTRLYLHLNDQREAWVTKASAVLYAVSVAETAYGEQRMEVAANISGKEVHAYIAAFKAVFLSSEETSQQMLQETKDSIRVGSGGRYVLPVADVADMRTEDVPESPDEEEETEEDSVGQDAAVPTIPENTPEPAETEETADEGQKNTADSAIAAHETAPDAAEPVVPETEKPNPSEARYLLPWYRGLSLYKTKTAETRTLTGYSVDHYPSSAFDGSDGTDTVYRIDVANASNISLHFNARTFLEPGTDVLLVYHADGSYAAGFTGSDAAGQVVTVQGYACFVRFLHAGTDLASGFAVDAMLGHTQTEITAVTNHANGNITVKWTRPYTTLLYQIQRAIVHPQTGETGGWSTLETGIRAAQFKDTETTPGVLYAYRVRGYTTLGSKNYYAKFAGCRMLSLKAPVITDGEAGASETENSIYMEWNRTPAATRYAVYRSESKTGTYICVGTTDQTTFTDTSCEKKSYYYKIKPYGTVMGTEYPGYSGTPVAIGYSGIPIVSDLFSMSAGCVKVFWNAVAGAEGYAVYRSTLGTDAGFSKIGTVRDASSYTDSSALHGQVNYYRVRSFRKVNGTYVYSDYSAPAAMYPLDMPEQVKAEKISESAARVTWAEVSGATAYEVFSSREKSSGYVSQGIVRETEYTVTGIDEMDENVYVRVKAIRDTDALVSKSYSVRAETLMNPVTYRALLIGNWNYEVLSDLSGPGNDVHTMQSVIRQFKGTPYRVSAGINATTSQMKSRILTTFREADCNDISLFFYSGHGTSAGSLCGVDALTFAGGIEYNTLRPYELRNCLDQIQGKKIVFIDACYSGKMIGKTDGRATQDSSQFTAQIVRAFSTVNRSGSDLASSEYYVLTACSGNELSWEVPVNNTYYGIFTRALAYGCGWDVYTGGYTSDIKADADGNGEATLMELYSYTVKRIRVLLNGSNEEQSVQVYPSGSRQIIWKK